MHCSSRDDRSNEFTGQSLMAFEGGLKSFVLIDWFIKVFQRVVRKRSRVNALQMKASRMNASQVGA